jgi:hypothetical protein
LAIAAAVVTARVVAQKEHDEAVAFEKWDYLVVSGGNVNLSPSGSSSMRKGDSAFAFEAFPLEQNLDKLGARGWELVAVVSTSTREPSFYFKRRR